MKSRAFRRGLQLFALICIFVFFSINFLQNNSEKGVFDDIKVITTASQNYFNDIGYWPISIEDLVDKNYLKGAFKPYSLLNQNGKLSVSIEASDKNNADLERYFIKYKLDKDINKILVRIEEYKKAKVENYLGICSNLSCPLY